MSNSPPLEDLDHGPVSSTQASIEEHGQGFLADEQIHSVSIGVYKEGKTYSGHFGELEKHKGNTANDNTLYSIASITKPMVGVLVAKAVHAGKIGLEEDVRVYLDGEYPNLEFDGAPIKIKHLLTHMSGLTTDPKGYDRMFEQDNFSLPYTKEDFFDDLEQEEIHSAPGTTLRLFKFGRYSAFLRPGRGVRGGFRIPIG